LPAVVGVAVYACYWLQYEIYLTFLIPGYAGVTMIWSTTFIETWKGRETVLRKQWNADALVLGEEARKGFRGKLDSGFYLSDGLWVPMQQEDVTALRERGVPALIPSGKRSNQFAKHVKVLSGALTLLGMGVACIMTTLSIMLVRKRLEKTTYGPYAAGGLNAVAISTFNSLFRALALRLNDWENHRLNSEFLNALVYKMSLFQFINCYFSLFYIAFAKPLQVRVLFLEPTACLGASGEVAGPDDPVRFAHCYDELQTQLLMIFVTNMLLGTVQELAQSRQSQAMERLSEQLGNWRGDWEQWREKRRASRTGLRLPPWLGSREPALRKRRTSFERAAKRGELEPAVTGERLKARVVWRQAEEAKARGKGEEARKLRDTFQRLEVDEQEDLAELLSVSHGLGATFYEYNEMTIQFGYLCMFAVAFPPAAMLALLNNVLEQRTDGFKLLYESKRVRWEGATGISPWDRILRVLEVVGVVTNVAVYALVSPSVRELALLQQVLILGGGVLGIYLLKVLIALLVPDVPESMRVAVAKERWRVEESIKFDEKRMAAEAAGTSLEQLATEKGEPELTSGSETESDEEEALLSRRPSVQAAKRPPAVSERRAVEAGGVR